MKLPKNLPDLESRSQLDGALHDLTNALSAAHSFGEVMQLRLRSGGQVDAATVAGLLEELDRAHGIVKTLRRETFRPGDVLTCGDCGYEFVHRKATGKAANCRRCGSGDVGKTIRTA